jgi:hypothetical protein
MTRLFLEIKNITLCAEPSFFILLYFLCKNLLFLCAEHHYPKNSYQFSRFTPLQHSLKSSYPSLIIHVVWSTIELQLRQAIDSHIPLPLTLSLLAPIQADGRLRGILVATRLRRQRDHLAALRVLAVSTLVGLLGRHENRGLFATCHRLRKTMAVGLWQVQF